MPVTLFCYTGIQPACQPMSEHLGFPVLSNSLTAPSTAQGTASFLGRSQSECARKQSQATALQRGQRDGRGMRMAAAHAGGRDKGQAKLRFN
eukprot:scaffold214799_cov28-Prasinocladus_malaysianus.AAC.1